MLWILLIGFFVGALAKFFIPGREPGGFIMTILLGIGGAMLANWAGGSFGIYHQGDPAGFIAAVLGSMVILLVYHLMSDGKKVN